MLNFSKTKIISIYLVFIFISFFASLNFIDIDKSFFKKKVNLGLDLQGGSYLLLEVDSSSLEKKSLQSKVIPLKKSLRKILLNLITFQLQTQILNLILTKII